MRVSMMLQQDKDKRGALVGIYAGRDQSSQYTGLCPWMQTAHTFSIQQPSAPGVYNNQRSLSTILQDGQMHGFPDFYGTGPIKSTGQLSTFLVGDGELHVQARFTEVDGVKLG